MNWEELVEFLEKEIPNADFCTGTHSASMAGGTATTYFLKTSNNNRIYRIRYSMGEIKQYANNDIFDGWIWIEIFDKGKLFKKLVLFIRPKFHSSGDGALILPPEYSARIKRAVVDKVNGAEKNYMKSIEIWNYKG